jgi:hypothetical protein
VQVAPSSSAGPGSLSVLLEQHDTESRTSYVIGKLSAQSIQNANATALGDLVGRNPDRIEVDRLILVPHHTGATSFDARTMFLVLGDVRFELDWLAQQGSITQMVSLTPSLIRVYYQDNPQNAVSSAQVDAGGHLRIPLSPSTASGPHGPEIDRIEIDLATPLQGVDVGKASLDNFSAGAGRQWKEVKPDVLSDVTASSSSGCGLGCNAARRR